MYKMAYIRESASTRPVIAKPPAMVPAQTLSQTLPQPLRKNEFLSSGPEDSEPSVDAEVFGKGGVGVDSEYDLELRMSGNMGRPGMGHPSLLTVAVRTVRW